MGRIGENVTKSTIGGLPINHRTKPIEPSWVTRLEEWGTETDGRELDNAYKKRDALAQEINRREKCNNRHDGYNSEIYYRRGSRRPNT